jgi:hypothetical protein
MENHRKKTAYDKILEVVAIALLLGSFYPLLFYNSIDSNTLVPIHGNFFGEVDRWGDRSNLWIIPLIGLGLYILMSISQKYPTIINYPCKITEKNANYIYRMGVQLVRHIKVFITLTFTYISNIFYRMAIGKDAKLNMFIVYMLFAGIFLLVIIYTIKMRRYKPNL